MKKKEYVDAILNNRQGDARENVEVFCPSNIALIKYWGKRQGELNLPLVSSLSYTLGNYGTTTRIAFAVADAVVFNGKVLSLNDNDFIKIKEFLDLFRSKNEYFRVETSNNIPTAAGVASSASGFAALTRAITDLKGWVLSEKELSMLARLGSGSAARSFWPGTVIWHKGQREDGMDCYAEPAQLSVKNFRMAVLLLEGGPKALSSREAMKISLATSPLMKTWPEDQQKHLDRIISSQDFLTFGEVVEENAVLLHRLLEASNPAIIFDKPSTLQWKSRVRDWRKSGLPVFFTQDAGANLKLIFPAAAQGDIEENLKNQGIDYFMV